MRWFDQLRMKMRMLFGRGAEGAHLDDELQFHLERQIAENRAAGMSGDEARAAALRAFGNPLAVREQARATWGGATVEAFGRDVRYGVRTLLRTPAFSLMAVLVMALCIGAATSLFTIVRSVLLRPLPFRDPDRLVMVYEHFRDARSNAGGFNYNVVSPADFYDWRTQTHGFEDMAAWRYAQFNITGEHGELPELVNAAGGSWNLFSLLGVQPALGRTFVESEDRTDGTAVMLTWSVFERRFGGDPTIVGRQIHLDGKLYTVVGVLPQSFAYPDAKIQVWVTYASGMPAEVLKHHDFHFTRVVARLRPNVSLASALSEVGAVQYQLHLQYPQAPVAEDVAPRSMTDDLSRNVKKPLTILMCAVGCMLLIGCLNVANLLVARSASRQKEIAIRGALGAQRFALICQQMTESLLVCVAGGAAGVMLSVGATRWLASRWKDLPTAQTVHVDGVVVGFACLLVCVAALLAGFLPALSFSTKAAFTILQASSRSVGGSLSRTGLRKTLLTIEIGVTVILLIAAGLLLKSFVSLRATELGCATENVLTLSYSLPMAKYDKPEKVNAFNETLLERVRAIPGVRGVALGSTIPGAGYGGDDVFTIKERPPLKAGAELPDALTRTADPGYFSALEIPLLEGRFFTHDDRLDQTKRIIVSRALVRQYFQGGDPIGKHLHVPARDDADYEIVGVVGDTIWKVGEKTLPMMYFPLLAGMIDEGGALAVRTDGDPRTVSLPVQKQIAALDPQLPVTDVLTLPEVVGDSLSNARFSATLVLAFAGLSLLLACVGLYGVLSYLMTQRMTEIGIRIALGARREQVLTLMLGHGLRPALLGLVIGLVASAAAVRLMQSFLYETQALDPLVFALVAGTLLLVAVLACVVPAWRASHLDPMQALRTE
jgi:putative ABC transport system permease protein